MVAAAAALAAVPTLRAAGWVVWPCLVAAAALASLAATGGAGWRQVAVGLVRRAAGGLAPCRCCGRRSPRPRAAAGAHTLQAAGVGVLLLSVFVPLFVSADAAFAHILDAVVPQEAVDRPIARVAVWLACRRARRRAAAGGPRTGRRRRNARAAGLAGSSGRCR